MNNMLAISMCVSILCSGRALAQGPAPEPKTDPAPAVAPAPAAPPAADAPSAAAPAQAGFENAAAVDLWMEKYYEHPEPNRVLEAFRTLVREKAIGTIADKNWTYAAFFWACMKVNQASMAEWCATIGHLDEPAKTWWWTAVWMSQTVAGNEAINEAMSLPEGHADRVAYKWLQDKPSDILTSSFRGDGHQQLAMLWSAFCATGDKAMIYKMYEGFVPAPPKPPKDEIEAQIAKKRMERMKVMVDLTRASFAQHLPKHPRAIQICKDSIEKLKDPVKSEITKLVADAEATLANEKPDAAPGVPTETKVDAGDHPPAPATDATPSAPAQPAGETKPEPKDTPAPEPKTESTPK